MKDLVSSDHLPPTSAASTTNLARDPAFLRVQDRCGASDCEPGQWQLRRSGRTEDEALHQRVKRTPVWCQWPAGLSQTREAHLRPPPNGARRGLPLASPDLSQGDSWTLWRLPPCTPWRQHSPPRTPDSPECLLSGTLHGDGHGSRADGHTGRCERKAEGGARGGEGGARERAVGRDGLGKDEGTTEKGTPDMGPDWDLMRASSAGEKLGQSVAERKCHSTACAAKNCHPCVGCQGSTSLRAG